MDNRSGPDLLSDLPVDIIESILMLLPIGDAIRTSILSTNWRYRWVSLPELVFDEEGMVPLVTKAIRKRRQRDFITLTLSRHEGPIHKFKLWVHGKNSFPDAYQLLLFMSRKGIKELILHFINGDDPVLVPSYLYSCRNLTFLELYGCEFGPPSPAFKGFLCLRTLILQDVVAPSGTIECLIANSPLLENLTCAYAGYSKLRISAPNLKYFFVNRTHEEIYLCAPLLAKMIVTLDLENSELRFWNWEKHSGCNYTKFLGGVTNIESLTGDGIFTEYLSNGIQYYDHPLVFHHLKIITLGPVNFENANEILVVVRLIMDAVNLSELEFTCFSCDFDGLKAPDVNFWNLEYPQNCTFKKLKVIKFKMVFFSLNFHELDFIKFVLQSSPVLETLAIGPLDEIYIFEQQEAVDSIVELFTHCRASTDAKILFEKR